MTYNESIRMDPAPQNDSKHDDEQRAGESWFVLAARYSHLAFVLPAATFVGWLIGAGLDRWLHKDWIVVPCVIFGMVVGMIEIIRVATKGDPR